MNESSNWKKAQSTMPISPVPASINNGELEDNICKAISLAGHEFIPDDLQACRLLKKGDRNSNPRNRKEKSLLTGKISAKILKTLAN